MVNLTYSPTQLNEFPILYVRRNSKTGAETLEEVQSAHRNSRRQKLLNLRYSEREIRQFGVWYKTHDM